MNPTTAYANPTTLTQPGPRAWMLPIWNRTPAALQSTAASYDPISLQQMDAVALLNRTDTKFVISAEQLLLALSILQPDYWMLSIQGQRFNHYRTLYFDTPDFSLYHAHINGRANRYKVRSREYTDSRLSFLEVKHKTPKGRTIKARIATAQPVIDMTPETKSWLHNKAPLDSGRLEPKLWNTFTRITLVSKRCCERVTLDLDVTFYTAQQTIQLDGMVIAEVKLDSSSQASPFLAQMRSQRSHPYGFSKYCVGVAMLYDQVKKNAIKPKMRCIEKILASQ